MRTLKIRTDHGSVVRVLTSLGPSLVPQDKRKLAASADFQVLVLLRRSKYDPAHSCVA